MSNAKKQLEEMAMGLCNYLEGKTSIADYLGDVEEKEDKAFALMDNALDISFKVGRDCKSLLDFEVTTVCGGPTLWCTSLLVQGAWGSDRVELTYNDEIGLFELIEDEYDQNSRRFLYLKQ